MKRLLLSMSVVLVILTSSLALKLPEAQAQDRHPCGDPYKHHGSWVQKCPLWTDHVPVFSRDGDYVGTLNEGGSANWFLCQEQHFYHPFSVNGFESNWWAFTMADNGYYGWVSVAFFSGGDNYEPDSGLRFC